MMIFLKLFKLFSKKARLLKKTGLFNFHLNENFMSLLDQSKLVTIKAGRTIIQPDEAGDTLFMIYSGRVKVFLKDHAGNEILLANLAEGDYFGEQSYLLNATHKRNAFVAATTAVKLIAIPYDYLNKAIEQDKTAWSNLSKANRIKLLDQLREASSLPHGVLHDALLEMATDIVVGEKKKVLFSKGDASTDVYFIINGEVKIILSETRILHLTQGQMFGELGVLRQARRAATAIFETETTLLKVPGILFYNLYQTLPELRQFVASVQRTYLVPMRGEVSIERGEVEGRAAIKSSFSIQGRNIVAWQAVNDLWFSMQVESTQVSQVERYQLNEDNFIELSLNRERLVAIKSMGEWDELGSFCEYLLDDKSISQEQLELFRQQGQLILSNTDTADTIVCNCMHLCSAEVQKIITAGSHTLETLAQTCGAGNVCGACRPKLNVLLGHSSWFIGTVRYLEALSSTAALFRVWVDTESFVDATAGQFIDIRFLVRGDWVERSYTVVNVNADRKYYDVAIKKQSHGYLSSWLFEHASEVMVKVSRPEGFFTLDNHTQRPLVFFAGGIGITPAMAYIRKFEISGWQRDMFLSYSMHSADEMHFIPQLKQLASTNKHFILKPRLTDSEGRLNRQDVANIANQYINADYYLCGPESYNSFISTTLQQLGIPVAHIKVEHFNLQAIH
jgi:ferredoxin-NADP reductase/CRP-like cAMP-binding protein/bacterioferritin-associated ferredoxin